MQVLKEEGGGLVVMTHANLLPLISESFLVVGDMMVSEGEV